MDGGIHALKGFIYQATVILDVLLPHFEMRPAARARPEGSDDLELEWIKDDRPRCEFIQIKKPSEDDHGRLKLELWTLRRVAQDLLPDALKHLRGNNHVQRWILGDDIDDEARMLICAGLEAPGLATRAYLHTIHLLARDASGVFEELSKKDRRSVGQWRFEPVPGISWEDALKKMTAAFGALVVPLGAKAQKIRRYKEIVSELHRELPETLSRIRVESTFGQDEEVRARVCDRFAETYPIARERIVDTVFGNMRAFVDDVSVRRGTWIDRDALDAVVARVWPEMMTLREPPPLPEPHIERQYLIEKLLGTIPSRALEIVGVAGSGKTSLARAVYDHVRRAIPELDVVYAEVRRDRTLREVLTGLAFHLRKRGISAPRDATERSGIAEEERVREVARALGEVPGSTLVLVDLVDGDCNDEFARHLSIFLQARPPERCTMVFFGQESALRCLTSLEQQLLGIPARIEHSGFDFEEFARLVEHFHANVERLRLSNVYQRAAAGRVAGLFARLAYDLARAPSVEVMERIVAGPPEQMVPRAVRERFSRLAPSLRSAADKLACLLLPFRPTDAIAVFPQDRIKAAIDKLLELGLLQHHDAERLEMLETVRRSLEGDVPLARRQETHGALAAWYGQQGKLLAEIHHLDCAGQQNEAHSKAREAFVAGQYEYALMDYVAEHRLVTGAELANSMLQATLPERAHLIPRLLQRLGDASTAEILMAGLRVQSGRFDAEYRWAWLMVESILACDPAMLYEITLFGLAAPRGPDRRLSLERLEYIAQGAARGDARVNDRMLALFEAQDEVMKWEMLALMVLDPRREVLHKVLPFVETHERPRDDGWSYVARQGPPILLPLRSREEIIDFLAAIPLPETSAMLIARSPQFGRLTEVVWARRDRLQPVCIDLLRSGNEDAAVLENCLRVLVLLGDQRVAAASEQYREQKSRLGDLSRLMPMFLPQQADATNSASRMLDLSHDINERAASFATLSMFDGDLGSIIHAAQAMVSKNARGFRLMALMAQMVQPPCEESVPLLEKALDEFRDDEHMSILAPLVTRLGALPGERVTNMLVGALSHVSPRVRLCACLSFQLRRSRRAITPLMAMLEHEGEPTVIRAGIVALVASGPVDMESAAPLWSRSSQATIWRHILAGRLRAESEARVLIAAAIDQSNHWQLRRAAILAASRMPFDVALAQIVDPVMRERSPFTMDKNHALLGHEALCSILQHAPDEELSRLAAAHGAEALLAVCFDDFVKSRMFNKGVPTSRSVVRWVADRLLRDAPPAAQDLQRLLDELHVPILHAAVLRGLRLAGRYERIEEIILTADVEWLLVRACCEYVNGRAFAEDVVERLRSLIARSRLPDSPFAGNVAKKFENRTRGPVIIPRDASRPPPATLKAADVIELLGTGQLDDKSSFFVSCQDESELRLLMGLLDPANDYIAESVPVEPNVSFVAGGVTVGSVQQRRRDNRARLRATLRPAVAAANRFDVAIPWHARSLSEPRYLTSFLKHLGAAGDADRLYQELAQHADVIIPQLDVSTRIVPIRKLVDVRIVPYLNRYAGVGTDGLLESLCSLASHINDPVIDPVLSALFQRWFRRFDTTSKLPQHNENVALWCALGSLRTHPRFQHVRDQDLRLMDLLHLPMQPFHKNEIVRILLDMPRSYTRLEAMLLRSASFEHGPEDEVDRLDAAADALFQRVQDA